MDHLANSSAASHGLDVIEVEPLTILAPVIRPKRRKMNALDLKDAKELFGLPEGWQVEQRARTNAKYVGKIDQYFYEPVTRKQFRSLKSVFIYLKWKMRRNQQQPEPPSQFDHFKVSQSWNHESINNHSQEKKRASSLNLHEYPPEKITWVLMDDERQDWSPFIEETKVPDEVKLGWAETFLFKMK